MPNITTGVTKFVTAAHALDVAMREIRAIETAMRETTAASHAMQDALRASQALIVAAEEARAAISTYVLSTGVVHQIIDGDHS